MNNKKKQPKYNKPFTALTKQETSKPWLIAPRPLNTKLVPMRQDVKPNC